MAESEFLTNNSLIAAASGEEITQADQYLQEDFANMPTQMFIDTYGEDTFNSLVSQRAALNQAEVDALAAGSRYNYEAVADSAKNILAGALTGLTGTASLLTTPIRPVSKGFAKLTEGINDISKELGSDSEQAQRDLYSFKQQGLKARIDRESRESEAQGKSVSLFESIGKEYLGSLDNLMETGQISEIASSGIGSLLIGGPMTKGIAKTASFIGSKAPSIANSINKAANQSKVINKIKEAAPWMTAMGLQEGGGTYGDMLLKGLDISIEELMANSPEFQTLYAEYRKEGIPHEQAAELAKEDLAFSAAREAGTLTALGAGAANILTAGMGKGIDKSGIVKSILAPITKNADDTLSKYVVDGLMEPVEETITEGLGQLASNYATKEYLDKNQDLSEDIGQSMAEGTAGGLGIVGLRAGAQAGPLTKATAETLGKGINLGKEAHLDWKTSEKRTKALIKDVVDTTENVEKIGNLKEGTLAPISEKLNALSEEIFNKETPVSFERSLEIAEEIQNVQKQYEELTRDFKDNEGTKESRNTLKKFDSRLKESLSNLSAQFLNPYIKKELNKQLDPEKDPKTVAEYLIQVEANQPGQGRAIFNKLAPENKKSIQEFSFDNSNLDTKLSAITSGSTQQENIPPQKSSYLTKIENQESLGEIKDSFEHEIEGKPVTIQIHSDSKNVSLKTDSGVYQVPTEDAENFVSAMQEGNFEKSQKVWADISNKVSQDNLIRFSKDIAEQESPEELNGKSQYRDDDGEIRDFDSNEVNASLKEKVSGKITNLVRAVKRSFHTWNTNKDVADNLLDIIKDDTSLRNFLSANKFTNTNSVISSLFTNAKGKLDTSDSGNKVFFEFDTVANQIRSMIGKDSAFREEFENNIYPLVAELNGNEPEGFKNNFEDSDTLRGIALIATVDFIARMRAYPAPFSEAFMDKEGINPLYQEPNFLALSAQGVESNLALQSFATGLRKIMGVAKVNDASSKEVDEYFGTLASKLVAGLQKSGIISIKTLPVKDRVYDEEAKDWIFRTREFKQISVHKDYSKLFGAKAAILTELIDPNFKNTLHRTPPKAKNTVAHTEYKVTKPVQDTIQKLNDTAHTFTTAAGAYASIGGHKGFTELMGNSVNDNLRLRSSFKDYESKKGQELSREQGFNSAIEAVIAGLKNIYFSNVALKNGRFMQEGAATFQNNKILRSMLTVGTKAVDLTDKALKDLFYLTLAQNLGEPVNKKHFETTEENDSVSAKEKAEMLEKVDKTLEVVRVNFYNSKYSDALNALVNTKSKDLATNNFEDTKANREALKEFLQVLNSEGAYPVNNPQSFAALVEMVRYVKAEEAKTLNNFTPELLCEIDGINDGPSYINAVCTRAISPFTSNWVKNAAKTGYYIGVDTTSQDIANSKSEAKDLMKINHPDFHAEVAHEKITEYFLSRLIASRDNALAFKTMKNVLTFFRAIGWVDGNIGDALNLTKLPKDKKYPIEFARDISKKLVTVIPYGSKPRGSMEQVLDLALREFYSLISENINAIYQQETELKDSEDIFASSTKAPGFKNGISFEEGMNILKNLFLVGYSKGKFETIPEQNIAIFTESFNTNPYPIQSEFHNTKFSSNQWEVKRGLVVHEKEKEATDIRNFYVTPEGIKHLVSILVPTFGEPAQAAVVDVIGRDGMQAAAYPAALAGILTFLEQGLIKLVADSKGDGSLEGFTQNALHKLIQEGRKLGSYFEFDSGTQAIVRKEYFKDENYLYEDPVTGLKFRPSTASLGSAEVAGGPLTVQAMGDASMILYLMKTIVDEVTQVYDGVYSPINSINNVGTLANKASFKAQNQKVYGSLWERVQTVGQYLINKGYAKNSSTPEEAITECLQNLASNKYLDGRTIPNTNTSDNTLVSDIERYLKSLDDTGDFEPDIIKQEQNKAFSKQQKSLGFNAKSLVSKQMGELFHRGKMMSMNEQVKTEVMKKVPMTVHHMSASKSTYKAGNPLSVAEASNLLKAVNDLLNLDENSKYSWSELMEAYLNIKAIQYVNNSKDFSEADKTAWAEFVHLNKGLTVNSYLPDNIIKTIDDAFKNASESNQKINEIKYQTHGKKAAIKALSLIKNKSGNSAIFNTLFGKLLALVPENTKIHIVSDVSGLPGKINSKNQLGAFRYAPDGTPILYIVDRDGDLNLFGEKNLETLCHEIIHSVISAMLHDYFKDKNTKNLTDTQKQAIENLDKLLDDFLDASLWEDDGNLPEAVINLRTLLSNVKDPAQRLDESLAYMFTNDEIFTYLSTAKFDEGKSHVHHRNWEKILNKLIFAAKTLWSRLIGIVSGSAAESLIVNIREREAKYVKDYHTFIELYGLNTVGLLNDETSPNKGPDLDSKRRRSLINSDFAPNMLNLNNSATEAAAKLQLLTGKASVAINDFNYALKSKTKELLSKNLLKRGLSALNTKLNKTPAEVEATIRQSIEDYKASMFNLVKDILPNVDAFIDKFISLQHTGAMSPVYRDKLTQVYKQIKSQLSPEMFVEDWNTATQQEKDNAFTLYNLLTGQHPLFSDLEVPKEILYPQFKDQAFFFALFTTYPGFANQLKNIKFAPLSQSKKSITDVIGALEDFSEELTNYLNSKEFDNHSVQSALNIAYGDQQEFNKPQSKKFANSMDIFFGKLDSALVQGLLYPFSLFSKTADQLRKELKATEKTPGIYKHFFITELMRKGINQAGNPLAVEFLKDFYGRTSSNTAVETLLKRIKGYSDKIRKLLLDSLPENLSKAFNKKITFKTRNFLALNFGNIEVDSFTFDEIKKYLTDKTALQFAKKNLLNSLEAENPEHFNTYIMKIKELADYITGKEEAGKYLLTNAYAISRLPNIADLSHSSSVEHKIKRLITLFCIENRFDENKDQFIDLFTNDEAGMKGVYDQIVEALSKEQERLDSANTSASYKYNRMHGWIPSGNRATGHTAIVSKFDYEKTYKKKGYQILQKYQASNIDKSEPMLIVYCKMPHQSEYQEGILQSINQTGFGYQFLNGTRGEITGARILDTKAARNILDNLGKESSGQNPIPLFDSNGLIIGFERSVPKNVRSYLNQDKDLFSGIAQYRARQEREEDAKEINLEGVQLAWEEYSTATDYEKNREFIDVFHTDNLAIKQAVARIPSDVVKAIKERFGDHFYLRKDELWTFLGYQRLSLTDMWDNQFVLPKKMEDAITKCIDAIASMFGKEGRYLTGITEAFLMGTVSWVRDTIIVRSGVVPVMNAIANIFLLHFSLGIPLQDLVRLYKENAIYTQRYNKLYKKKLDLIYQMANSSDSERARLDRQVKDIELEYKNLPIYRLIKDGEYSSISVDGAFYEEIEIFKQKPEKTINSLIEKYPSGENVKKFLKESLLTKGSVSYTTLAEFVNQSDWLAKTVAYRYLTEPSKKYRKPMLNHDDARNMASILFVDFDQFVGRERDWTNRIGATWFMTYKYRMIPAAILSLCLNPTRMILGTCLDTITGLGTPITENLITKLVSGNLANSVGLDMIMRGLLLHPLAVLMKAIG